MIKLSDYLNYLQKEIVQARKNADLHAIKVAKQYAEHEYLKYFKVPRFSMPTIKLDIPLKITDINTETKYEFDIDKPEFVEKLNTRIEIINKSKKLNIPSVKLKDLENNKFNDLFKNLKTNSNTFTKNLSDNLVKANLNTTLNNYFKNNFFRPQDDKNDIVQLELKNAFRDVLLESHNPISTKLNDLFINPDSVKSGENDDDKLMVNLHVEMIEEAIRLVKMKDKDGNDIEEITFE